MGYRQTHWKSTRADLKFTPCVLWSLVAVKRKLLGTILLLGAFLTLTAAVLIKADERTEFLEQRAELVVRKIGHDLLLHAGDSTSRVLPVKKLGKDIFQLEFQNEFSFMPDSLIDIVRRSLAAGDLPLSYMVRVFECGKLEMVYGFEVRSPLQIVEPCLGRVQPTGCYTVQIAFTEPIKPVDSSKGYYFGVIALLTMGLLAFVLWKKPSKVVHAENGLGENIMTVGTLEFEEKSGFLRRGDKLIHLSSKESKLLKILASNRNQLVDREQLQNEIWTSEGVITSRSLDMFVSKLRKKLSDDPSIRIVNIHGRGYILEVGE
jgi:hypothetical protein